MRCTLLLNFLSVQYSTVGTTFYSQFLDFFQSCITEIFTQLLMSMFLKPLQPFYSVFINWTMQISHLSGIMRYLSFCDHLTSPSMMSTKGIRISFWGQPYSLFGRSQRTGSAGMFHMEQNSTLARGQWWGRGQDGKTEEFLQQTGTVRLVATIFVIADSWEAK